MRTRQVFEAIAAMILNYNERATQAVKVGDGKLYVPGYMSLADFLQTMEKPRTLTQTGGNPAEPAYLSFEEGLRGRNRDGSEHNGFIVIDPIAREIVAIVDRNKKASFDSSTEILDGLWGGYYIDVTNSKGEKFEIETVDGVRGLNIPVTVIFDNGNWSVIYEGHPLPIRGVKRV